MPLVEKAEVMNIYKSKGFEGKMLNDIVDHISSNNEQWVKFMMKEELELTEVKNKDIYVGSFVVGLSALVGSFVPLTPFFLLPIKSAVVCSLVVSAAVLMFIGIYKAKVTVGNPLKSGIQMVLIGMGAALAGYYIGHFFGQ
jgi:predicted membrane protein (TIGR00267 family)